MADTSGTAATKPKVRLTALSHGAGCACKLGSVDLAEVLRHLPSVVDPRVLVDAATRDDAAVFRLSADRALVATTDFFTPDRRQSTGVGRDRRRQRAERRVRHGRHAALRAEPRGLAAREAAVRGAGRGARGRGRGHRAGPLPDARRALDRRARAAVRARRHRRGAPRSHAHQRRRLRRRRAGADQAARHGHPRHGPQARRADRDGHGRGGPLDDHAQRGRRARRARRGRAVPPPTSPASACSAIWATSWRRARSPRRSPTRPCRFCRTPSTSPPGGSCPAGPSETSRPRPTWWSGPTT